MDAPPTIDARYRSLTCFNCGEPGHFVGICGKPKVCFICAIPGHHMDACPRWLESHPIAKYYGSASQGLGFYHVEVSESSPSQWLNLSNCGVVHVLSGQISLVELEKELADIYCKDWPWQIRELEPGSFLVRFPPHRKVADMKNYPSVGLRKPGVQIEILEWVGESVSVKELQDVWVQIRGIPPKWCDWSVFAQISSGFGLLLEVDWPTIFKSFYEVVRVKISCRNPSKIPLERLFEMKKKLYIIAFAVEDEHHSSQIPSDPDEPRDNDDKENDDEADDLDGQSDNNIMDSDPRSNVPLGKQKSVGSFGSRPSGQNAKTGSEYQLSQQNLDQRNQMKLSMTNDMISRPAPMQPESDTLINYGIDLVDVNTGQCCTQPISATLEVHAASIPHEKKDIKSMMDTGLHPDTEEGK